MILKGRAKLAEFMDKHTDARDWLQAWIAETEHGRWQSPSDIKKRYASVSFLRDNVVIFNVKGNEYRLEVQVAYNIGIIDVRWAGTHTEYTKRYK